MTSTLDRPPAAERTSLRVPPHSREAEEAVLGAILLSDQAANEVMDKLASDDFYVPAHQSIFEAIVALYNSNQPLDAVTVSEELRRRGNLEKVGGVGYLTRLVEVVPAASNIEYYATIVEEHGLRRSLIRAGSTVTDLAFRTDDEIALVIDRAEQQVLSVAEKRGGQGMLEVGPLFQDVIERIESLEANGSDVTGLATGFRDLDRKLAGLQPANLVVIAARPSMGKCLAEGTRVVDPKTGVLIAVEELFENPDLQETAHVLSLNEKQIHLVTAAPSAVAFNGVRDVFRVTTRLGREVTATANHPLLTIKGWRELAELRIGDEIAVPRHIDVFGVDRRLDAEVALLGYLIGDGTVTGGTPRFTNTNPRLVDDVRNWAGQLGLELTGAGSTYHLSKRDRISQADIARSPGISGSSVCLGLQDDVRLSIATRERVQEAAQTLGYSGRANPLSVLLAQSGLRDCDAGRKFVPELVFRLPKDQLALFLNRLYATDGSAWISAGYYRVEYATVSDQLASDVQHLLARFGIVAKKRRRLISDKGNRRPAWEVAIQDPRGVEIFAAEIGIFGKESALNEVMAVARSRRSRRARSELLPMSAWDQVLSVKGARTWAEVSEATGRPRNHNWHVRTRRLSRGLLGELGRALTSNSLLALASSDVVWDPIVSIESAGLRRTYDLCVPLYENLVADDVIVHNSALTLNIATNAASLGKVVALFSLEMSKEEVVQRILCSVGRVDSAKLRTGQLGAQNWDRVVAAAGKMYKAPIFIDDSSVVTVTDIRAKCRRLLRARGLDLVVVDYLQLMQGSSKENRQQEIAEISRGLKNLARELSVPIIAVSQLNRSVEQREDRRPRLSDLRESGALEQDSDVVMFIYRHEYYHPDDLEKKGLAEVNIAKHRAGATGAVEMTFLPDFTRFADIGRDLT
jgi:replicative DNA helicase